MASFIPENMPPSSISDEVKAAGARIGIDVDKLRKKYLTAKLTANLASGSGEDQVKVKQQLEDAARMRRLEAGGNKASDIPTAEKTKQ